MADGSRTIAGSGRGKLARSAPSNAAIGVWTATVSPAGTRMRSVPLAGAGSAFSIFMASKITTVSPSLTISPTLTSKLTIMPGMGAFNGVPSVLAAAGAGAAAAKGNDNDVDDVASLPEIASLEIDDDENAHCNDASTVATRPWTIESMSSPEMYTYIRRHGEEPAAFHDLFPAQPIPGRRIASTTNMDFFHLEHTAPTSGIARIVLSAIQQRPFESTQLLRAVNILWSLLYCWVSLMQTHRLNECHALLNAVALFEQRKFLLHQRTQGVMIPLSRQEVMRTYRKGRFSMMDNIPRNRPEVVGDHVYMPLRHYVAELFALGLREVEPLFLVDEANRTIMASRTASHATTERGKEIFKSLYTEADTAAPDDNGNRPPKIVVELIVWSDGFDPNTVKKDKG